MPSPLGRAGAPVVPLARSRDLDVRPRPAVAVADATGWKPSGRAPLPLVRPPVVDLPPDIGHHNGTPIFKQGDERWGRSRLGTTTSIGKSGCAMTSVAMAMSKISGEPVTPDALNAWLRKNRGYSADALDWSRVGKARGLEVRPERFSLATIDAHLEAGKPVVIGVDYKAGSNGGANGTDHWICVTGKNVADDGRVTYTANDPGTGKTITLTTTPKGALASDGKDALGRYRTTGQLRVFVRPEDAIS